MARRDEDAPEAGAGRTVTGTVKAVLPRALYRVAITGGADVTAHATAGPDRNFVRLVVGDVVTVALSARDLGRGRIVRRGAMAKAARAAARARE